MQKAIFKITFIMFSNLLAFVGIGLILDAIFYGEGLYLLASVLISLPIFGVIMYLKMGSILGELQTYNKNIDGNK